MKYHNEDKIGIVAAIIDETSLDNPLPLPKQHIFVKEKVNWHEILDNGQQFDAFPSSS